MKLISLNTWGGRAGMNTFLAFLKKYKRGTDIFCFQEIWEGCDHNVGAIAGGVPISGVNTQLLTEISGILPEYKFYFRPHVDDCYGLALFVRKNLSVLEEGEQFVYQERGWVSEKDMGDHARNVQYLTVQTKGGARTIVNFHGLWNGKGKTDCDERLEQSENVLAFLQTLRHTFVFVGDFNLLPETESLQRFEKFGLRNLISEYNITSTRTSFYKKEHRHADYALVCKDIEVNDFKVLPDEVSDHSPLFLDFE